MTGTFGAAALAVCLVGCEQEKTKTETPSASAPPPVASTPPPTPSASAPPVAERKPVHPCPEGSTGKGTFEDACKAKGKKRMMTVTWDKKIGDKGPTFKIVNEAKLEILYGKIVVYFYDKAGKQMDATAGDKPRRRLTCAGDIFAGPVKPGEKVFMNFSCVKKEDVPKGAVSIEGEIQTAGFADDAGTATDTYWRNDDLAPDERPKRSVK